MRVKITFDHGLTYIRDSDTGKMLCSILAFELSMDSRRPGESTVKVVTDTPLPTEEYEELEGEIEATVTGQTVLGVSLLEEITDQVVTKIGRDQMWHYTDAHIEQIAKRVADHFTHDIKKSGVNR